MATPDELVETRPTGHGRARGLVSDRTSGHRVDARTFAVPDDLADVCASFWMGEWDLRGQPPHETELLGDPCVHIVFEDGGPHAGSRVVGVWTKLWRRTLEDRGRVHGVKLKPGAVRAFVGRPAVELANRITPLTELFDCSEVEGAVLGAASREAAFATFANWLRERRRPDESGDVSLAVALVERITSDGELTTVEAFSDVAGMSVRALQRLFREHVGASPKWTIRRHRLQEVAVRLERGEALTLAGLAADLGYTDHAHLTRDFKAATGRSPSAFASSVRDGKRS
ncbi:MAG: AraC family transcriptional regulator [Deltaproteobacteria bacterium]|nr:AraC family transcriptional regulator [Deltaproteobacteria bacterium]